MALTDKSSKTQSGQYLVLNFDKLRKVIQAINSCDFSRYWSILKTQSLMILLACSKVTPF